MHHNVCAIGVQAVRSCGRRAAAPVIKTTRPLSGCVLSVDIELCLKLNYPQSTGSPQHRDDRCALLAPELICPLGKESRDASAAIAGYWRTPFPLAAFCRSSHTGNVLYTPDFGYYARAHDVFGSTGGGDRGDFVTAPELSPVSRVASRHRLRACWRTRAAMLPSLGPVLAAWRSIC